MWAYVRKAIFDHWLYVLHLLEYRHNVTLDYMPRISRAWGKVHWMWNVKLVKWQYVLTPQFVKLRFTHYSTVGLQTHLLQKCVHKNKIACPVFSLKQNMLKCSSINNLSSILSPLKLFIDRLRQIAVSRAVCFILLYRFKRRRW